MAEVTMTMEEYLDLLRSMQPVETISAEEAIRRERFYSPPEKKKKTTAYQRRYKANFKKIAPKYKLKSGKWKKGGFKRAVKEAHRLSKK